MKKARILIFLAAMAAVLACAGTALDGFRDGAAGGDPAAIEDAVRRAAAACYSTEGRYPDTVDYLERKYGLRTDPRYAVHYVIFASNLPPEITVTAAGTPELEGR